MTQDRTEYKVLVLSENDGADYHLWVLVLKTALSGEEHLETIADQKMTPNINRKTLCTDIISLAENPLPAIQNCELANDM